MENIPVVQTTTPEQIPIPTPSHKNYFKLIVAGIVILGVFISGGLFLGKTIYPPKSVTSQNNISPAYYPTNIPTEVPISTLASNPTANWQTYTGSNFNFNYPNLYSIQNLPGNDVYALSNFIVQVSSTLATGNQYGIDNNFTVSNTPNVPNCPQVSQNGQTKDLGMQEVGGANFHKWQVGGAGGGNSYSAVLYQTMKQNTCYQIDLVFHTNTGATAAPNDVYTKSLDQSNSELGQILSTFKFLDSIGSISITPVDKPQCQNPCSALPPEMPCNRPIDYITLDAIINSVDEFIPPKMVAPKANITVGSITEYRRDECATYGEIKPGDSLKIIVPSIRNYVYPFPDTQKTYEIIKQEVGKKVQIFMTYSDRYSDGVIQKIY